MTKEDFLARCANAWDAGRASEEVLIVMQRWADMVLRLQGGQFRIWLEGVEAEKDRTQNFHRGLAGDAIGYKANEFMAILRHPCQTCATDAKAWWTRPGFCPHHELNRANLEKA